MSSLMVGLTRAAGIRVGRSAQFPNLGAAGDIWRAQHCRAEVYLEDRWMPVDPADMRKVVPQDRLPLHDPRVAAFRGRAFGAWEMNYPHCRECSQASFLTMRCRKPSEADGKELR